MVMVMMIIMIKLISRMYRRLRRLRRRPWCRIGPPQDCSVVYGGNDAPLKSHWPTAERRKRLIRLSRRT